MEVHVKHGTSGKRTIGGNVIDWEFWFPYLAGVVVGGLITKIFGW